MIQIIFILLLFLVMINLIIADMDYFNPCVVFNIMFTLYALLCCIVDYITGLEIRYYLTVVIIISGSIVFTIVNIISREIVKKPIIDSFLNSVQLSNFVIFIAIIIEMIVLVFMYKYVNDFATIYNVNGTFSEKLSFYDTITKFNSEYKLRMPWYVSIGNLVGRAICYIALYVLIRNIIADRKVDLKYILIVCVYFIGSLMGGRTEALRVVTASIFLWYYFYKRKYGWRKGSFKIAINMAVIAVLIVIGFSLMRGILGRTTYDPIKVVFGYIGAPLKNFDTFLLNPKKSLKNIWGAMTFTKFINWLGVKFNIPSWVYVSDQPFLYYKSFRMGNVYTTYYNFYYDFGIVGCLVLIGIIAIYYCFAYRTIKSKKYNEKKIDIQVIVYSYLFNDLIMLPFSSRFYETIVNINFIRFTIILFFLTYIINNCYIKNGHPYIRTGKK